MTPNSDAKLEEEPTCRCKNDMRNLANFHGRTQKSWNWHFDWFLVQSILIYELKKYITVMCNNTEEWCGILSGNLSFEKLHEEIGEFLPWLLETSLKICNLFFPN